MPADGARRDEILETAATVFASSGLGTSLQDIADACGILPGSLYHHFESKEAIIVELVRRYREDLDRVAREARGGGASTDGRSVEGRVIDLGRAIAACAVRHRAALLLTLYEPPTWAGEELLELARQAPAGIDAAMFGILDAERSAIRPGVPVDLLSERLCQSMLHVGVGVFHRRAADELPAQKCRVLLRGIVDRAPSNTTLDRSPAMRAAREAIDAWDEPEGDDRLAHLRVVARTEFGRRGYEATTIRHIAKASGLSTGTIYRLIGSKEDLLLSIMVGFSERFAAGWDAVVATRSTWLEQLDALMWININVLDRFSDEFKVELAWLRQAPPTSADLGMTFGQQIQQLQEILAEGERSGALRMEGSSALNRARSLYELILTPDNIVHGAGPRDAHVLARETVLRGAMVPTG